MSAYNPSSASPSPIPVPPSPSSARVSRRSFLLATGVIVVLGMLMLLFLTQPAVNTSEGAFAVSKARYAESVPPGCTSRDHNCAIARPGYRFLLVTLKPLMDSSLESCSAATLSVDALGAAAVVAADGSRSPAFQSDHNVSPPRVTVAFAVDATQRGFKLAWADNPVVELNPLLFVVP